MCFKLFISTAVNKKDFRKMNKGESCFFVGEDEISLSDLSNEFQEFIYSQDLERLIIKTMKSKRFSSAFMKTTESHKNLIVETTYDFFISEELKIIVV